MAGRKDDTAWRMLDLRTLKDTPPWDWPEGTGKALLEILRNDRATESDLLLASELAGDYTVINDELAAALISVMQSGDKSEKIRSQAAISLGPVLERGDDPRRPEHDRQLSIDREEKRPDEIRPRVARRE